jgi:hypothetical protein
MLPRCNLGDYTTSRGVQIALARDSFGKHLAAVAHQGDRRLIAARLNRKDHPLATHLRL